MPERPIGAVSKTVVRRKVDRGFESLSLRLPLAEFASRRGEGELRGDKILFQNKFPSDKVRELLSPSFLIYSIATFWMNSKALARQRCCMSSEMLRTSNS